MFHRNLRVVSEMFYFVITMIFVLQLQKTAQIFSFQNFLQLDDTWNFTVFI